MKIFVYCDSATYRSDLVEKNTGTIQGVHTFC